MCSYTVFILFVQVLKSLEFDFKNSSDTVDRQTDIGFYQSCNTIYG